MQSYDCSIEHIPGKTNPADGLSRRHWDSERGAADMSKAQDKDLLEILRVTEDASDEDIRKALKRVFRHKPTEETVQEQSEEIAAGQLDGEASGDAQFRHSFLEDEQDSEDFFFPKSTPKLMVTRSSVTVDNSLLREMMQLLRSEEPYADIISRLENTTQEVLVGVLKYRLRHGFLKVHRGDMEDGRYWKTVVPNSTDIVRSWLGP